MALSLASLLTPVTEEEALDLCLSMLTSLGFNATSWQDGSNQRTLVQLVARLYSSVTETIAQIAAGGFNTLATGEWLTILSKSHFENDRIAAIATEGTFRLTASATAPVAVIAAGDLQISTTATQTDDTVTYRNLTGGTLNPGTFIDLTFQAETSGALGNIPNNTPLFMWTPLVGVATTNPPDATTGTWITVTGIDQESDDRLTIRNATRWATLSYSATDGAYVNWALDADDSVTRVKVRSNNPFGPGTVDVICATLNGGITGTQEVDILSYIEGTIDGVGRRPLNDVVSVNSATVVPFTLLCTVTVDASFQTQTTFAVVAAALVGYFNGLDIGGEIISPATTGVVVHSKLIQVIADLPGVISVTMTTPTANVALGVDEIVTEGSITGGGSPSLTVNYV